MRTTFLRLALFLQLSAAVVSATAAVSNTGHRRLEDGVECVDEPDIAYMAINGASGFPFPDGALEITGRGDGNISFAVNQIFNMNNEVTLLAVKHNEAPGSPEAECQKSFYVSPGERFEYTSLCIDNRAEVSVFVYVGDGTDFDPTSCAACEPADDSSTDFVQYYMEINCDPVICPTMPPTDSPTMYPTVNCPEDIQMYYRNGGSADDSPIDIIEQTNNTVKFRVKQPWIPDDVDYLYVQYHNETEGGTDCVSLEEVGRDDTYVFTAYCMVTTPRTLIDIWVSDPSFDTIGRPGIDIPDCCHPPEGGDPSMKIQYSFLLNCVSACETPAPFGVVPDVETEEPTAAPVSTCKTLGGDFSGTGYVAPDIWSSYGISSITASGGYTPNGQPRLLDTNPAMPGDLIDPGFGSPNDSCDTPGPGVGVGGMEMAEGENCDALGSVIVIPRANTAIPESDPNGGDMYLTFENPKTLISLVFFNLSPEGALVTLETTTGIINLNVASLGRNAVQVFEVMKEHITKVTIHLRGIGALAGLTICEDPDVKCPDDVDLYYQRGGPMISGDLPIDIVSQTGRTVTFRIEQEYLNSNVDYLYTQYRQDLGERACDDAPMVPYGGTAGEYTAYCTIADNITVVNVFLSDPSLTGGNVTVPDCCPGQPMMDNNPLAEYTFLLYCNPQCI